MLELQPDLRLAVPEMVASTAVITMLLAAALYFGEKQRITWSPATILAIAAVARLLFLFRSPELSDDIYRYLWDGLTLLGERNPYAAAPAAVQSTSGALAVLQRMVNHSGLVTIYPPAAQLVFAAGALPGGGVIGIKALLVLFDLGSCFLILRLLATFRLPAWMACYMPGTLCRCSRSGLPGTLMPRESSLSLLPFVCLSVCRVWSAKICRRRRKIALFHFGTTFHWRS